MSRSFKKNAYIKDGYGSKWKKQAKRRANSKVKSEDDIANGGSYKKVSNSWDICDWKFELPKTKKGLSK